MSSGSRQFVVWMVLVLLAALNVESCIEEERLALLDLSSYFKSHLDPQFAQYFDSLYGNEKDKYNCCSWMGVTCNSTTLHVIELNLESMHGPLTQYEETWIFNVTMLQPFSELTSLDLSSNAIGGFVDKDGSTRLSTLKNLQSLVLNGDNNIAPNNESGQVFLSALSSLKTLRLTSWGLNETTLQGIEDLRELQELDISDNKFGDSIFQKLANLRQLKVLDLSMNFLLNGSTAGLCDLKNLTELHLRSFREACHKNLTIKHAWTGSILV